ncbi:HAAS signaling domain-containing protein [Glycomyces xiaoerkulensis]|uniref:HAAS signaling domain-containing protein n=1 Tax=Glycomyces xiaoerkulensis TaxID=2038139 RepID=UPI000C26B8AD|nr:hypothetical protein [Glycomyces xiaoerkulensis]
MTDTPQGTAGIAEYRLAVERHLSDLPAGLREDLLSGLEEHLAEVAADMEPGMTLNELLGSPETYARELREAAGVERQPLAERLIRGVWGLAVSPITWMQVAADRFTRSAGAGRAGQLRRELKPGWWVLRGIIAGMLVAYFLITAREGTMPIMNNPFVLLPTIGLIALPLVWLSLRLGVRSQRWSRRGRLLTGAAGAALVAIALANFPNHLLRGPEVGPVFYEEHRPRAADLHGEVRDVYVYSENGELLRGVYLFDQNGNPVLLGDPESCPMPPDDPFEEESGSPEFEEQREHHPEYGYQYPLCLPDEQPSEIEPDAGPTLEPTETPEAEPSAEAT